MDIEMPDEFGAIVAPLREELTEIGEIETAEAVRDGSVAGAAAAAHYLTLISAGVPARTASKLTREYAEMRTWGVPE